MPLVRETMQAILSVARAKKLDRVAAAYAVAGWLLVQAASILLPAFGTPTWALRALIAITLIGFPVALFVAWFSIPHPHPETLSRKGGLDQGELLLLGLLGGVVLLSLIQLGYSFWGGARTQVVSNVPQQTTASKPRAAASANSLRVAIIPFDVVGTQSEAIRGFADTLLDKIVAALSADQVDTVSRSDSLSLRAGAPNAGERLIKLGVGLTLEGSVQSDDKTITVRVHLDDVPHHQTLWSREFDGPADSPEPLQTQVALHATDVTRWAVSPKLREIRSNPSLVAAFLEGEDEQMNGLGGRSLAIARDLVARAPRFAAGHTLLASCVGQENGLAPLTLEGRTESTRQAKIAIALDGGDGQAYALLSSNLPALPFQERERLLLKGLAIEPDSASANWDYTIQILASTGRAADAVEQARSAWQLVPFTVWVAAVLPFALVNAGRIDEARTAIAEMKLKWPQSPDPSFAWAELAVEGQRPPFARALELLDAPLIRSTTGRWPGTVEAYRTVLRARLGSAAERQKAAQLLWKWGADRTIDPWVGFAQLVSLGDVDGVFRAADLLLTPANIRRFFGSDIGLGNPYLVLFGPQAREVRRDLRFMPLAKRMGLVDYWRATDHWPDFCSEPGLPYNCKIEAAKLAAAPLLRPR